MQITVTAEPVPVDNSLLEAAEELLNQAPAPSPFALKDDHEFKAAPQRTLPAEGQQPKLVATAKTGQALMDVTPIAPVPGSPDSPYRKCSCLAVMPGRTCNRCLGSKWVKPCPKCDGQGRIDMGKRRGSERSQPCGFCMATGQVSANRAEIVKATALANAAPVEALVSSVEQPAFRRAARFPGIGSPEKKRKGRPGRRAKKAAAK